MALFKLMVSVTTYKGDKIALEKQTAKSGKGIVHE